MRLILLSGVGLGLVTVVIDVIAGEAARNVNERIWPPPSTS